MTGFEPGSSGIGSDRAANCATTTARFLTDFIRRKNDQTRLLHLLIKAARFLARLGDHSPLTSETCGSNPVMSLFLHNIHSASVSQVCEKDAGYGPILKI